MENLKFPFDISRKSLYSTYIIKKAMKERVSIPNTDKRVRTV